MYCHSWSLKLSGGANKRQTNISFTLISLIKMQHTVNGLICEVRMFTNNCCWISF